MSIQVFNAISGTFDIVSLAPVPATVLDNLIVQAGTTPVAPTAATITMSGAVVAAGSNPIRTNGTSVSVCTLEVQKSQAIAATDATKIGLAAYDSSAFSVDSNGFVQLKNQIIGTVTTSNDTPTTIITLPLGVTAGSYLFRIDISGFNASTPAAVGYFITSGMKTTGIVASVLPNQIGDEFEDTALALCDWNVLPSSNNAIIQVKGATGLSINWKAVLTFTFMS